MNTARYRPSDRNALNAMEMYNLQLECCWATQPTHIGELLSKFDLFANSIIVQFWQQLSPIQSELHRKRNNDVEQTTVISTELS
jgi:hypothetical protein